MLKISGLHQLRTPLVGALIIGASACTPMQQTSSLDKKYLDNASYGSKGAVHGIPYYLPATVVPVKITGEFQVLPERRPDDPKKNPPPPEDHEYVLTVTVGTPKQVPDPRGLALLQYNQASGADDEFRLNVGSNGLLSNVKSKSIDRTGDVLVRLVELAKAAQSVGIAYGFGPKGAVADDADARRRACFKRLQSMAVETEINVTHSTVPLDAINRNVLNAMQKVPSVDARGTLFSSILVNRPEASSATADERTKPETTDAAGVVFRLMTPASLTFVVNTNTLQLGAGCSLPGSERLVDSGVFMAAHPTQTFVVDTSRGALVTKRVDLAVTDGVLTGIEVDKPSEVLAAVSLPVNILKAIASIPAELLTFKVTNVNAEKSLTAAEVELLKQQIELIKQKQALEDAQKASGKTN